MKVFYGFPRLSGNKYYGLLALQSTVRRPAAGRFTYAFPLSTSQPDRQTTFVVCADWRTNGHIRFRRPWIILVLLLLLGRWSRTVPLAVRASRSKDGACADGCACADWCGLDSRGRGLLAAEDGHYRVRSALRNQIGEKPLLHMMTAMKTRNNRWLWTKMLTITMTMMKIMTLTMKAIESDAVA